MTQTPQNLITARVTMAVTKEVTERLKTIAKDENIRMYEVMDAMIELIETNKDFYNQTVEIAKRIRAEKANGKPASIAEKAKKLPAKLRSKLSSMSVEELTELLKKAGL